MNVLFLCDVKPNVYRAFARERIGESPVMDMNGFRKNPVGGVEYIFSTWGMPRLDESEITGFFPNLKAVFYAAGSVQDFARPFLAKGARVFSGWGANAVPVAEFAVAQILLSNKGYFRSREIYRERGFEAAADYASKHKGNYRAEVGVLGAGMIGRLVIGLLKRHDLELRVFDPFLAEDEAERLGVAKAGLMEIFSRCDAITNHLADNDRTKGILTHEMFGSMKEYATFINTGRGAQIDGDALIRALREKPGVTALLDVTDPEEPLPADSPYFNCGNAFVTPHSAGSMSGEIIRMGEYMFEEYEKVLAGRPTKYEVSMEMLETMA